MKLLAIDGSLTATGLVVVELGAESEAIIDRAFVQTFPGKCGRHVYTADDDGARIDQIADEVIRLVKVHSVDVVAVEAPAGSQSATSAKALGLAYGVIRGSLRALGYTPVMIQAHHAKIAATGATGASKSDVERSMAARFGLDGSGSKERREAIADACAVGVAAMGSPTVQALRRRRLVA